MSDYESGHDPKYGYNRNAFAHKTVGTAIMGRVVKLIATPIGLVGEAIQARKDRRQSSSEPAAQGALTTSSSALDGTNPTSSSKGQVERKDSAYVEVPPEVADELIASGQAEPTEGYAPTHELIPDDTGDDGIARDEVDWVLDEAAAEDDDKELAAVDETDTKNPQSQALTPRTATASISSAPRLPFPVILPQRRPGTKTRGFVRAYAPVLEETGIPQEAFLRFLKDFHQAAQASPIFDVVMIATAIAAAYPDPVIGLGVQAVQVAVGIGQEIQERYRTNKFLTQANRDFFKPKGLYAMIVTYRSGSSEQLEVGIERADIGATAVAKYGGGEVEADGSEKPKMLDDVREKMQRFRVASGETHGEAEMPVTCAPLIFPALDAAVSASSKAKEDQGIGNSIKAKSKSASKFVNDYYDRRAQASYVCIYPLAASTRAYVYSCPFFLIR